MNSPNLKVVRGDESDFRRDEPPLETQGGGGNDGDMRERIAKLEAILTTLATKADIGELRADFERGQKENRAWMLATVLALIAGIVGAGGLVLTATKPSPAPAAQPAPIIIQVPAAPAPTNP